MSARTGSCGNCQKKIFHGSDIWDPGEEATTSFRSSSVDDFEDDDDDSILESLLLSEPSYPDEYEDSMKPFDAFSPFYSVLPRKPVGSGGHSVSNRSAELDDILEEDKEGDGDDEHDGSPSPPAFSNSITCSPQESFRMPRGVLDRRSQVSDESSSTNSSCEATSISPPMRKSTRSVKHAKAMSNHRNLDSGFSDSGSSQNCDAASESVSQSQIEQKARVSGAHVSKIYLFGENYDQTDGNSNHVSILDCETGRVRKGFIQGSVSALLSPPMSPPSGGTQSLSCNTSMDSEFFKLNSTVCSIGPFKAATVKSLSRLSASTQTLMPTSSARFYAGTSSLGRQRKRNSTICFPKTNGSLYESLSLGRSSRVKKYNSKQFEASRNYDDRWSESCSSFQNPLTLPIVWHIDGSTDHRLTCNPILSPPDPVQIWLRELGSVNESECTIMLQSKPVAQAGVSKYNYSINVRSSFWSGNSRDVVRAIQSRAHAISAVFVKICRQLSHKGSPKLTYNVEQLSNQVQLFLNEYGRGNYLIPNLPGYKHRSESSGRADDVEAKVSEEILDQQLLLWQSCERLRNVVSRNQDNPNSSDVVDVIRHLGDTLTKLIELMLSKEIKSTVQALNKSCSEGNLSGSIDSITDLALEGNHLCRLIAKHKGVRILVKICYQPHLRSVRVNAFRALGTVCCVLEGIKELEKSDGIRILAESLSDPDAKEDEKSEAAGLLAQVTSPWIENNKISDGLFYYLDSLIHSLTDLSDKTRSSETFLLATAALANLTFMDNSVAGIMKKCSTVSVLTAAVLRQQKNISIFIQDQVAAIFANLASSPNVRSELIRQGGLPILVQFLKSPLPPLQSSIKSDCKPESLALIAATERVLQKSAIAISRLCNVPSFGEEVVKLDGLARLVELCKIESSRFGSDGVLVACLAAVRKIASVVGPEHFETLDASELVEQRLLDSFLIFSSKNESFV